MQDWSGQSWAAKPPNTLLSPSDTIVILQPVFKSVRASLICFHSAFSASQLSSCLLHPIEPSFQIRSCFRWELLPVKDAAFTWSPYLEQSYISLIAICPNHRARVINSPSLLILMKCQHCWACPPHQPSTIDKAPLTDACGRLVSTHYVIQRIEYNTPNATYLKSLSDHWQLKNHFCNSSCMQKYWYWYSATKRQTRLM